MICEFCKIDLKSQRALHGHIKKHHNSSQKNYYHLFFPRYDLGSGNLIDYINYEDYFKRDFNSRQSFINWASNLDGEEKIQKVKQYCIDTLIERKNRKNLHYFPSQVELKSLFLPSFFGLQKIWSNDLDGIFDLSGLVARFVYNTTLHYDNSDYKTYVDTREQTPLPLKSCLVMKLSVGDYAPSAPLYSDVFVERKSLNDLASTLSSGWERFLREIDRARSLGAYIVVIVESSYDNAIDYSPNNSFAKKINGGFLFHQIRNIMENYNNLQFLFCSTRRHAVECMDKIFRLKDQVKNLDLEYLKDMGEL